MREPQSELDVIFMIGKYWDEIVSETPLEEIEFHDGRSDGDGVPFDATGVFDGQEVPIEVETKGSKFFGHNHDEEDCRLVICWNNNHTSAGIAGFESREWTGKSDHPAFEDVGIDVIELQGLTVYRSD